MQSEWIYLGLGSNLNNPLKQLQLACTALAQHPEIQCFECSSFYKTPPYGYLNQHHFINAVARCSTSLSPSGLLHVLKTLEQMQNRTPTVHWGPRTLDLDILLYGTQVIQTPDLTIPHPDLYNRPFVIIPWYELAPTLRLPTGRSLQSLLEQLKHCDHNQVQRLETDAPPNALE
jgi:2-amino-4-hydroxy-6-hydroxymethyldihydropteridine diphosphokinase